MREQLSDREFLEYVRIGTGLGSRSVKSFERLRVLAGASVTVPVPHRIPDNNWNLLLDLAQSRLDLKVAEIIISDLCASAGLTRTDVDVSGANLAQMTIQKYRQEHEYISSAIAATKKKLEKENAV